MAEPWKTQRVAFYFSAHADDWQLFMTPAAFQDAADADARCVFVHMTAGDAGLGLGNGGRKHPLYRAREHGSESAIRFMAGARGGMPDQANVDAVHYARHTVRRVRYRDTAAFFLRLPDGSPEGTGYEATGFQSLKRLAEGMIGTMAAIDGSASYRGWPDLVAMLQALIVAESAGLVPDLHVPESDVALNPGDHADHLFTGRAVLEAAAGMNARIVHHVGYASGERPENLAPAARDLKCAVYAVTAAGVAAFDHPVSWRHYDELYAGRDYSRTEERRAAAS